MQREIVPVDGVLTTEQQMGERECHTTRANVCTGPPRRANQHNFLVGFRDIRPPRKIITLVAT